MKQIPVITLILAALAVVVFVLNLGETLQYDRVAVHGGAAWRVITSQWTHWSVSHLVWDVAVFTSLGIACERRNCRATVATIVLAAILVPAGIHWLRPSIMTFRGLSGIDSALFGLLCCRLALRQESRVELGWAIAAWLAFAVKTAIELRTHQPIFMAAEAGVVVVPEAHLIGLMCGTVAAALLTRDRFGLGEGLDVQPTSC